MEEDGSHQRLEDMGDDDERTPDDPELERAEDTGDEDDVEAHALPAPPPRPMNGL